MTERNAVQGTQNFYNPAFREIYKNTWLKRVPSSDSKKKKERVWVVFCVHDDTEAFLELYVDNKAAVLHKPSWYISLNDTQHVSPSICAHEQEYEFVITLSSDVIRLAAPSRVAMLDWVESLRGKLNELKILTPKENLYSKLPENRAVALLPTRDPTSPLPPPPSVPPVVLAGIEPITPSERASTPTATRRQNVLQRGLSWPEPSGTNENLIGNSSNDNITIVQVQGSERNVFNFENISSVLNSASSNVTRNIPPPDNNSSYERLFQLQPMPGPSNGREELSIPRGNAANSPGLPQSQVTSEPYLTLREHQVMQLQKEMNHQGGVRLLLRKRECMNSIALVDAFDNVWICGWKQKENPLLYNVLHIGDRLITIQGYQVRSASDAQKILKSITSIYVQVIVKRVPQGQVFVIRREVEGQSLGIVQEGNSAVIANLETDSLAARQGISVRARTCDGLSFTNWVITEINGRPLNLFFKENQVKDRLNSVGRDISILVQPLDLIKQLKKQLKSLKNYKEYILQ